MPAVCPLAILGYVRKWQYRACIEANLNCYWQGHHEHNMEVKCASTRLRDLGRKGSQPCPRIMLKPVMYSSELDWQVQ